jgi:hypothetical protein
MTPKPGSPSPSAPIASEPTPLFEWIKLGSHSIDVTPGRFDFGPNFRDVTPATGETIALVSAETFRRDKR